MPRHKVADLSFGAINELLKVRASQSDGTDAFDVEEALSFLTAIPDGEHTAESLDALLQLARILWYELRPAETLLAASLAARLAVALNQRLSLCCARGIEGVVLAAVGKFAEATIAQSECWALAREVGDRQREVQALGNLGVLCGSMGQYDVAARYLERTRELAVEHGFYWLELSARSNLAVCAIDLGEPTSALKALSQMDLDAGVHRDDVGSTASAHHTLARAYLMIGDLSLAETHAHKAAHLAQIGGLEKVMRQVEAVRALIAIRSGSVESGLRTVHRALADAKAVDQIEVLSLLHLSIDAHEAAGYPDRALAYLQEVVDWKKQALHAHIAPQDEDGISDLHLQTDVSSFDDGLIARAHSLRLRVYDRSDRFVETAINAEIAGGHDLYRTFRVAKLAQCLAETLRWDAQRVKDLAIGTQLCNIGMIAIPTQILLKPEPLSAFEHQVMSDHTRYGAELLRKSKLRGGDIASLIAEQHHERYDGAGYPRRLRRGEIAEEALIVSICDAFDAMTHRRPWRTRPLTVDQALDEIRRCSGAQFDPLLANAFASFVCRELSPHADIDAFLSEGADEFEYVRARARMETYLTEAR